MSDLGAAAGLLATGESAGSQAQFNALLQLLTKIAGSLDTANQTIGNWTPVDNSGAGLVFTSISAGFTKIGNMAHVYGSLTYPTTGSGANASLAGLPFNTANAGYARQGFITDAAISGLRILPGQGNATAAFLNATGGAVTNATLSGTVVIFELIYPVT